MGQDIIKISDGIARHPLYRMREPVNVEIKAGEHLAITGPNGGGKSMLVDILTGKHPLLMTEPLYDFAPSHRKLASDNIKYVTFRDSYGDSDSSYYYQQRWNQQEINESTPKAGELLEEVFRRYRGELSDAGESSAYYEFRNYLYSLFDLRPLLDKYIILLSSGELRKFELTKTLLAHPRVLILDNPFIGLDSQTRLLLNELLTRLSRRNDLTIILVVSRVRDIPSFITHVIEVDEMKVGSKVLLKDYMNSRPVLPAHVISETIKEKILAIPESGHSRTGTGDEILKFNHVTIRYDERVILNNINWTVRCGEHWALSGENGAGKSTLLSLVCADNPQAYACDIELFGRKRGTGESIWDIKKHIGYVSPEMHRAYLKDLPAIDIVASGLKDSVGLYQRPKPEEKETCKRWMEIFGIASLADKTFLKLSSGEQRLALLARAFVKDPGLLILDEPLHGLDDRNCILVKDIIEAFCARKNKTLVMVSHYKDELPSIIDHSLFLKKQN